MNLLFAELRKVWGNRTFPLLLAVLAGANLLLLWLGTRPSRDQPPAAAYRAVGADLAGLTMEEKGVLLHEKLDEAEAMLRLSDYYRILANGHGDARLEEEYADILGRYGEFYRTHQYVLYTDTLLNEYRLFNQLVEEYETVAGYTDFLAGVQERAQKLASISIFQTDASGYDIRNIERTAAVYASLGETTIDYYPQKGLYTAISYTFTDLILIAAMLLLALLLVRQERDSGLLCLIRSLPGGRLHTALAKLAAFALSLLAVLALLYGINLVYCGANFGLGPLGRTIQSVPALMRCTMQITVGKYLFLFLLAKWAGAFVLGLWVMLAALAARRIGTGWMAALLVPLLMLGIRVVIPATSRLNVIKYANLVSLLQTNELLGSYRNLYWFGAPVSLPLVEWLAAILYGAMFLAAFCAVFAKAPLLPAPVRAVVLRRVHKTHPTSLWREETRKLLLLNGAALYLLAFLALGIYEGVTSQSYLNANEIYYAYYTNLCRGPYTQETIALLKEQGEEFAPMLETQRRVQSGELPSEAMRAYTSLQMKYSVYQQIIQNNIGYYIKEHPGAWLLYENGYRHLFSLMGSTSNDLQDTLLAGLLCAACFSGVFAMERKGGMDTILSTLPLGRKQTVVVKLGISGICAAVIALLTCLPHLWQIVRDYGLPCLLAPAISISEFELLPRQVSLSDVLLFWVLCRIAACLFMAVLTLWLSQHLGNMPGVLLVSTITYCLPALLSLSGMSNGIEWLSVYPLFSAGRLLAIQGYTATGDAYNDAWLVILLFVLTLTLAGLLSGLLMQEYEYKGLFSEK